MNPLVRGNPHLNWGRNGERSPKSFANIRDKERVILYGRVIRNYSFHKGKGCKKMNVCGLQGGGRSVNDYFREGLFCSIAQIAHPRVVAFFAYDWKLFLYDASIVLSEWIKSVPFLSNLESLGRERPI